MKSYGSTMPGGPLNIRAVPFPIGEGVAHVAPLPEGPAKKATPGRVTPAHLAQRQAEVCEAYREGELVRRIANRHGISRTRVYGLLKAGGVTIRKASA